MFARIRQYLVIMVMLFSQYTMAENLKEINFGIMSTESSRNLRQLWDPFLKDMEKQLNIKVNPFFASDYAGIIQAMRFKKVDVAWLGNAAAIEAVDRANGEVFSQTVNIDGSKGYWSLLIVHKDSPYQTLDEVISNRAKLTFGNGDPNSTSGFLVPAYYVFSQRNIQPSDFKRTLIANHESNALAVANKQVDVATNNTESLLRLKETNPAKAELLRVIWKSPLIPSDPLVWRKDLSEDDKRNLKNFLLNYGSTDEKEKEILRNLTWKYFADSSNNQLLPVRQLRAFTELKKVKDDTTRSETDKAKLIETLEAQLHLLDQQMKQLNQNQDIQ